MALDTSEAMLLGRLQESVAGLERVVKGLTEALHEFRDAYSAGQRLHDSRITALEKGNETERARSEGAAAGFSRGQKAAMWGLLVAAAWGVKSGAVDIVDVISRIGK